MLLHTIGLSHSFDSAHRVVGHEGGKGKCARLHGHTYNVEIEITAPALTSEGFVVDFAVLKNVLNEWDHKTLLWSEDPLAYVMGTHEDGVRSLVPLPFNPTSENMAAHLARRFFELLAQDEAQVRVTVRETAKSRASCVFPPCVADNTNTGGRACTGRCSC